MQLQDNDMDDLFREAAEHYPLKVTGADWNKVLNALSEDKHVAPVRKPANKKNLLWLLLLLLIPFVCNYYKLRNDYETLAATVAPQKNNTSSDNTRSENNNNKPQQTTNTLPAQQTFNSNRLPGNVPATFFSGNIVSPEKTAPFTGRKFSSKAKQSVQVTAADAVSDEQIDLEQVASKNTDESEVAVKADSSAAPTQKKALTDKVISEKDSATSKVPEQKKQHRSDKKLYLTILGGADASRVKTMSATKITGSIGATLGYKISKHFAVEAGALYSSKHYSTEYVYFDNSKTQWPANRIIKTVDGTCEMIEIPVTLRYNFAIQQRSKFFAAAGLSSYIMKKENYNYDYTLATGGPVNEVYKTYKNSGTNRFSTLQLSAGWQRNIGRTGAVRVQPYYNVPLKGMGIGKLPISGAGVLAGISIPIK